MQLVTVGTKYQIVIPKEVRKKEKGLRPGTKVLVGGNGKGTITVKTPEKNWSDKHYGALKKYWRGVDPIAEIEKIRNEWDEKSCFIR